MHQQFRLADAEWEEAVDDACLARRWADASDWVASRRLFAPRWRLPTDDEKLLMLQQSIRQLGDGPRLTGSRKSHIEDCLHDLNTGSLRGAALSAQQALRDAVTRANWHSEQEARLLLAQVLQRSGEFQRAAEQFIRGGDAKGAEQLADACGDLYLDVADHLRGPNYWTSATAFALVAKQADLVPDGHVNLLADAAMDVVRQLRAGTLIDGQFAPTIRLHAVKGIAGLAGRLAPEVADELLRFFEEQPPLDKSHYRFHDEAEAIATARIAATQPQLRPRALTHLIELCNRSQTAQKHSAVTKALDSYFQEVHERIRELANNGESWAIRKIFIHEQMPDDDPRVQAARERLAEPLVHQPHSYTLRVGAVDDSLLVRGLPPDQRAELIRLLVEKSRDPHVFSTERGEYLLAAANLGRGIPDDIRAELFDDAFRNVDDPAPSEADNVNRQLSHPLNTFQFHSQANCAAEALVLAAELARTDSQQSKTHQSALALLRLDPSAAGAAHALHRLPLSDFDTVVLASHASVAARQLAALRWSQAQVPADLGMNLARDPSAAVRRELAHNLSVREPTQADRPVRDLLAQDPHYSIRSLIISNAATTTLRPPSLRPQRA